MSNSKYISLLAGVAIAASASAQTLEQEVVIDREITPVERPANRPTWVAPSILAPRVEMKRLSLNEYVGSAEITRTLPLLDAAAWADSVMRTPYRGYASIGYFPVYNLGASAGYRFVNTDRASVGARLSYEGATWTGDNGAEGHYNQHRFGLGADASVRTEPGTLSAEFGYAYSATGTARYPYAYERGNQGAHLVNLGLGWTPSSVGRLEWNARFDLDYVGFANAKNKALPHLHYDMELNPVKDLNVRLASNLALKIGGRNAIAVDVEGRLRHINDLRFMAPYSEYSETLGKDYGYFGVENHGSQTLGIITLRPGYRYVGRNFRLRLGIRADINLGGYDHDTRIAPDIDLQWAPSNKFSLYARATGGEVMNTSSDLWQRNPWMTGVFAFERSHVNGDIELGLTFGSYRGFWATIHGGWTSVADWLHPVVAAGVNTWCPTSSYDGFNYGLELGYAWRDKVTVIGHVKGAQHGDYYRWEDNAKWAFDISAKVRPVSGLQVETGYEARVDRFGYELSAIPLTVPEAYIGHARHSMGDTSNLFIGASYDLTEALTVFLKAENLLNHRWDLTPGVLSRGTHGLLGAQLKF